MSAPEDSDDVTAVEITAAPGPNPSISSEAVVSPSGNNDIVAPKCDNNNKVRDVASMTSAPSSGSFTTSDVVASPTATSDPSKCCEICPPVENRSKINVPKVLDFAPGEMMFDCEGRSVSSQTISTFFHLLKASSVHNMFFNHSQVVQRDSIKCRASFTIHSQSNRYADIPCIEETRVKSRHPLENHDYIHANWVDGYREPKKFIVTQAPMPHTMDHFWSMILEHKALVVVSMIQMYMVKEPEISLRYIPLKSGQTFKAGTITVLHCGTRRIRDTYDAIILKINDGKGGADRKVLHIGYFGWADKGTPTRPTELLNMVDDMNHNREILKKESIKEGWLTEAETAPIVIHCLTGTGRSCTVVALDIICRKMDATHKKGEALIDVEDTVLRMRMQRALVVQKAEQYMLLHLSSAEYALRHYFASSEVLGDMHLDNFKYTGGRRCGSAESNNDKN